MRARLTVPILSAALLAPLATLSAQQTVDGWRATMTMTVDSGDGRPHVSTSRQIVAEGLVRTEITSTDVPSSIGRGTFMVINAHDSTIMTVLPSQQTAMITPSVFLAGAMELPSYASHATASAQSDLGPGEKILGHDTRHYRTTAGGSVDATMNGKTCTREIHEGTSDTWVATDIDPWPMLEMQMRAYGPSMAARFDSTRKVAAGAPSSLKGLPIRSQRIENFADSTGQKHTVTMTMEYTEYEHGPLDRSLFEVPAGYRVMDMRTMPGMTTERIAALARARPNPLCGGKP